MIIKEQLGAEFGFRFSQSVTDAFNKGIEEAANFNSDVIGIDHLFLGLIPHINPRIFEAFGTDNKRVYDASKFIMGIPKDEDLGRELISLKVKNVFRSGIDEARDWQDSELKSDVLFLAMLKKGDNVAYDIWTKEFRATVNRVRLVAARSRFESEQVNMFLKML
ncbi:MAG: hypothetical protein ACD_30C00097G0003 [uncultured bacterium]|uniref:Clp R domain-containing protein n=3 Tax=Candidatus Daviesiibacteriota TaxID=1752718 RepID=A0A0G0F569_9BACT|nr:MAG: hypothetical protein ACD_30C00097G0003 [uncultured bacterium]KKQ08605.1 MAG: hypothetical protein US19_C0021G0021 [Candidatus Daviesbacteria bacterium GW2011_GWB1_36_5]KKQ16342.1 MAG: hypothetical protein US28_C0002G0009 [Candidatus Daviesbacteria bacterium GW2011_GWA1_36_8]OGE33148.1 MAG: hypothetical protein A3C99_03940 [Candidatus Daviesbacteria bacterium RIFCSPHIGHO2_02_FULL_37_9]OGE35630.1 MAG: hypothetical protein A3E66_04245 [Candidatus Daviesbacteria bacterium RIFCSPHIGHO2_12_FU